MMIILFAMVRYVKHPDEETEENRIVLDAMVGWGQDYFQCRGCQKHFMKMVNNVTNEDNHDYGSPAICLLEEIKKPEEGKFIF